MPENFQIRDHLILPFGTAVKSDLPRTTVKSKVGERCGRCGRKLPTLIRAGKSNLKDEKVSPAEALEGAPAVGIQLRGGNDLVVVYPGRGEVNPAFEVKRAGTARLYRKPI
jgi:hypothetical protein